VASSPAAPWRLRRSTSWLIGALVVAVATFSVVSFQLWSRGEIALAKSRDALAKGDAVTAIARARDAAMARAPFSPYPAQALGMLAAIAQGAESRGDFDQAAFAWRALRVAIRATRTEGAESARLDESGRALVRLASRVCEGSQTRPPATCAAAAQAALLEDDLPATSVFAWLALGAVAFLAAGAAALQTGDTRRRVVLGLVSVAGAFVAALALASR
jgi:hypothetical protein